MSGEIQLGGTANVAYAIRTVTTRDGSVLSVGVYCVTYDSQGNEKHRTNCDWLWKIECDTEKAARDIMESGDL